MHVLGLTQTKVPGQILSELALDSPSPSCPEQPGKRHYGRLFGFIPLLFVRTFTRKQEGWILLFIPLLAIKRKGAKTSFLLFFCIPPFCHQNQENLKHTAIKIVSRRSCGNGE